jgi:hypothetical protein
VPTELPTIEEILETQGAKVEPPPVDQTPEDIVHKAVDEKTIQTSDKQDPIEAAVEADAAKEAPPEEPPPAPKKDPQAARFAALARRDREARQRIQDAENRLKMAEEREKQIQERETRLAAAKKHPIDLLKEHGYSYADATQAMLGNYKPAEPDPVDTKLSEKLNPLSKQVEELKAVQDQVQASLLELQKYRVEIAQRELRQSIEEAAKQGEFKYVEALGDEAYALVQDVITEFYKKHKRILNYDEACGRVDKYYKDRYSKLASVSAVPAPSATQKTPPVKPSANKSAKESKTLTNSLTQSNRATVDVDAMSPAEARAYLATKLRFLDSQ